jgi:hypothetical protein
MDIPSLFPDLDDPAHFTITHTYPTPFLRDFDIFIGQKILYLFDYGDEWRFRIIDAVHPLLH